VLLGILLAAVGFCGLGYALWKIWAMGD